MTKIWVTLGAAVAISAAAFMHSKPAAAHDWAAPASYCHGAYYGGGNCCGNEPRGLFTSGIFGGCGCGSWQHPATPYVQPYYQHSTYPYVSPYYRHYYRPYWRHHGIYRGYGAYHRHGVYRAHYHNGHVGHW
ncbi:MAG TPA: hypothetical protein VFW22_18025 [Pseudolabrys sp.]|nr:hypothetical protein [Pseudolabrys sp.]